MIRNNIILCVLFAVFVIQAEVSLGLPFNRADLKVLLTNALKVSDCARVIPVNEPIPLRFRRASTGMKLQCIITLN